MLQTAILVSGVGTAIPNLIFLAHFGAGESLLHLNNGAHNTVRIAYLKLVSISKKVRDAYPTKPQIGNCWGSVSLFAVLIDAVVSDNFASHLAQLFLDE